MEGSMHRLALVLVVAGLLVAASATPAAAGTTRIYVEGQAVLDHIVDPGTTTMHGTVMSVREMIRAEYGTWNTKYFTGPEVNVVNFDLDTVTGTGHMWGWGRHTPTAVRGGGWFCVFADTFTHGVYAGQAACIGTGSLHGWLLRAEMHQTADGSGFTGFIVRPHH
jgi:hypothetical protein